VFTEDAIRIIADKTRPQFPTATRVTCQIVNYASFFEYHRAQNVPSQSLDWQHAVWAANQRHQL
jgi:hypothetical protein